MKERGASEREVLATVAHGERIEGKRGRVGFRHTVRATAAEGGFAAKELVVFVIPETDGWLVITVIVKYLRRRESLQ